MKTTRIHILLIFLALAAVCHAASVRLALEGRSQVYEGQTFNVKVLTNGVRGEFPQGYDIPGAKLLYVADYSGTFGVNGRVTHEEGYMLTVKCYKPGTLHIPPVTIGGTRSNALTVKVLDQSARGQLPGYAQPQSSNQPDPSASNSRQQTGPRFIGKGNENLFMVASVSRTSAYEQQALVYTVKLYSSFANIHFLGATEAPKFNGFTLEEDNPKVESLHFESYKGRQYACAVIARYIIFPQQTGRLSIQGNRYTVTAEARQEYWDPFWGNISYGKPVQLVVQPNDLTVDVRALPQPQPAGFSGGVGKFSISASMPTQRLATNQAASIVYTVSGTGNIKYVTLPDLAQTLPKSFDVSTPTPEVKAGPNGSTVQGTVRFDCSVMPQEEGTFTIPPVELVYFNPETGRYETARSRSFKVTVAKGKASASGAGRLLRLDADLMPYTGKNSSFLTTNSSFLWYWLMYPAALLVALLILWLTVRYRRLHADTQGLLERRARRLSDRLLRHARRSLRAGDREHFFTQTLEALWGYAAHKLRMPGSEMQRANIETQFEAHQVPRPVIDRFIALLDRCEEAKYAGSSIDMPAVYEEASQVIRAIDSDYRK